MWAKRLWNGSAPAEVFTASSRGFPWKGALPAPGTKIQADGKDVGEITSTGSLPTSRGPQVVALGYVRREFAGGEKPLVAGGAKLTTHNLPFAEIFEH